MKKFILASASPRRKELLSTLGIEFDIVVSDCEEVTTSLNPTRVVMELSMQKAKAVWEKLCDRSPEEKIIIGADTVVSVDEKILGKPSGRKQAYEMIYQLQGRTHQVYTGVTIIPRGYEDIDSFYVKTDVNVAKMSQKEIEHYISTDEPYDKAGAYGIQGLFGKYVEGIVGDYNNVVGLPIRRLYEALRALNC